MDENETLANVLSNASMIGRRIIASARNAFPLINRFSSVIITNGGKSKVNSMPSCRRRKEP